MDMDFDLFRKVGEAAIAFRKGLERMAAALPDGFCIALHRMFCKQRARERYFRRMQRGAQRLDRIARGRKP